MPPKQKFQEGEKILCYHGPLIYEAKCQQSKYDDKEKTYQYHIHYSGWNKSWDEWVPEGRVLQYNDANLQKQIECKKAQKAETKIKKKRSTTGKEKKTDDEDSITEEKKKRLKSESGGNEQLLTTANIKVDGPFKDHLIEDWNRINNDKKLVTLPASQTVEQLIRDYIHERKKKDNDSDLFDIRKEVARGIKEYFNVMLGSQLLYENEREQYEKILDEYGEDEDMSGIYGGIHLVRMLTRLGWAIGFSKFDEISVDLLIGNINDFTSFLTTRANAIFSSDRYTSDSDDD